MQGVEDVLPIDFAAELAGRVPSAIYSEVAALSEADHNRLRAGSALPPERYPEEMSPFQAWTDLAGANSANPIIVRAQVITQLDMGFDWLRDSLLEPVAKVAPGSTVGRVVDFLSGNERRHLRSAFAHGRWGYLDDFSGLEVWDGRPLRRRETSASDRHSPATTVQGLAAGTVALRLIEERSSYP